MAGKIIGGQSCRAVALLGASLVLACGGPCGPFPGGRLSGREFPYPALGFAGYRETTHIAVQVGRESPHSVQTWVIVLGDELYVPADFFNPGKRWPHLVLKDPRARLRIGEEVFEGRLVRVSDEECVRKLRLETARKYEIEEDSWAASIEVWWFRFDPAHSDATDGSDQGSGSRVSA